MIICLGLTPAIQRAMVFEHLRVDGVNRAAQVIEAAAGKSVNVAKVVHVLGHRVLALGLAGGGRGEQLRRELDRVSIAHDFVEVEPVTRMCVTVIDRGGLGHTELIEESQAVAPAALEAVLSKLAQHMEAAEVVVLSGTLTPQAPADFYARCVVMAAGCGVRTIVDAQGLPLELALAAHPTVVKPNRAELAATLKMPVDTDADLRMAMGKLVERGVGNVVVSLGAEGVAATDGQEYWRLTVPKVPVINSIGSGDALAAGLAVGLARNMDLAHACQLGAACGTANAMTLLAGEVDTEEVRRLVEQVEIE